MAINDDRLAYYKQQLGVSDGSINDLEYRWLLTQVAISERGAIPDMWRAYLNARGLPSISISDGRFLLPYPLNTGTGPSIPQPFTPPTGFRWELVYENSEQVYEGIEPVVELVRI